MGIGAIVNVGANRRRCRETVKHGRSDGATAWGTSTSEAIPRTQPNIRWPRTQIVTEPSLRVRRVTPSEPHRVFGDLRHVLGAEGVVVAVHDELAAEAWTSLERNQDVGTLCRLARILEDRAVGPVTQTCHHEIGHDDAVSEEE